MKTGKMSIHDALQESLRLGHDEEHAIIYVRARIHIPTKVSNKRLREYYQDEIKMSKKTPEPAWLNTDSHLKQRGQPMPGPWELHINRYPNGTLAGKPYIYAPNGPDTHRHICLPCLDPNAPAEIQAAQEANACLLAASRELLEALQSLFAQCEMVHRYWGEGSNAREADAAIKAARAAIAKARGEACDA